MKDSPQYAELLRQMQTSSDDDCPGYNVFGRHAELAACTCGFARRHDFIDQVRLRLERRNG